MRLPAALLALAACALAAPSAHAKFSTPRSASTTSTFSTERSGSTTSTTFQPFNLSTSFYVWGLDLDGTLQGAGGVGGLLAVVRDDGVFLPAYDANGNITEYVTTNGEIVAHYDYSPFGEQLVSSGPLASAFTHRFSTKPWCADTGLNAYVYRKYRPDIGRWMCRDPIYEKGGANLNRFIANSSINFIDISGCFVLPVILIPPEQNPFLWTCHTAMQQCHTTIKGWRDLGYHFAADLLEHFINGGNGDYIPFPDNIAEIISNGHSDICKKVAEVVCGGTGTQRLILIKPDDENDSNIRWWYLGSNKNMLYAYGGARITISGTAMFDSTGRWSGEFDVEIKDKYEWVKADGFADIVKEYLSRLYSQTYDAAVYLQQNCGKKVFSHVANFDVTCTGCCQQVGSQR